MSTPCNDCGMLFGKHYLSCKQYKGPVRTHRQTLAQIRAMNLTVGCEYRIAPKGVSKAAAEAAAYYTNDLDDALSTARHMAQQVSNTEAMIGALTKSALNVLDMCLTDQQRHIADQVYDLCNQLEGTL